MIRPIPFKLAHFAVACTMAFTATVPLLASAQTAPPAGQAPATDSASRTSELTLSANASSEIKQDTVQITLSIDVEANDQVSTGKRLTEALDAAMKRAKESKDVEASTGSYRVWADTNSKGKTSGWRGQGTIVLQSKKFEEASALASKLGDKTAISNVNFSLSREGREAEERKLLNQAASAFRERALAAANAFGFTGYRISKIQLGGSGGVERPPQPYAMKAAMAPGAAPAANVPLEADTVVVSVGVTGTVVLQ